MMSKIKKIFLLLICGVLIANCTSTQIKLDAYPAMYDERQPVSILVIPAINQSTAAEATDYFNVTINEPLSNTGYYTMPVEIVKDIFLKEGIVDSTMIKGIPTSLFKKNFGADAVLFITIKSWDKNYAVLAANVEVSLEYVMLSTTTNEVLWSYSSTVVLDTTAQSSGFIIADLISTAISTAAADYVPLAMQANYQAFVGLPHGKYSDRHGQDGQDQIVTSLKESALSED
tara:strand:+ start:210 stop:899 length:690 start_codon:yes stop_codon:yes gene_type:complete